MFLEDITRELVDRLEIGSETPIEGNFCKYCLGTSLTLLVKLKATNGTLAGVQRKVSAHKILILRCEGCKRESEGK